MVMYADWTGLDCHAGDGRNQQGRNLNLGVLFSQRSTLTLGLKSRLSPGKEMDMQKVGEVWIRTFSVYYFRA